MYLIFELIIYSFINKQFIYYILLITMQIKAPPLKISKQKIQDLLFELVNVSILRLVGCWTTNQLVVQRDPSLFETWHSVKMCKLGKKLWCYSSLLPKCS